MPELPEVRALAERLDAACAGRRLASIRLLGFSGLKTVSPAPDSLDGCVLAHVKSRGKFVLLQFDGGTIALHLGNSGRVDLERPAKATRPRGSLVRLTFDDDAGVLVREHGRERRAGLWVLAAGDDGPLATLGPEPFDEAFGDFVLHGTDTRRLHTMLRDQHTVAGVGRGYADDLLQRAGLSPFASLAKLDDRARQRLLDAARDVLTEALEKERQREGGLSAASLGDRFSVHRRAGLPCPTCATPLARVAYDDYEIVYCPRCQTQGKVLADRRLSRLLK